MKLYDWFGRYTTERPDKIVWWYDPPRENFSLIERPTNPDITDDKIREIARVSSDWTVIRWKDSELDSNHFVEWSEGMWWVIQRKLKELYSKFRYWFIPKLLKIGYYDRRFLYMSIAETEFVRDSEVANAIYQYLLNYIKRDCPYLLEGDLLKKKETLESIYTDWYCFERKYWIEAFSNIETWVWVKCDSAIYFKITQFEIELYKRFDKLENHYLKKIINCKEMFEL